MATNKDLDAHVDQLYQCKHLPEIDVKVLCEKVTIHN